MNHTNGGHAADLLGMIARQHRRAAAGSHAESAGNRSLESAAADADDLPPPSDVTDRLRDLIDRVPEDEIADREAFALAREALLAQTAKTVAKAKEEGPRTSFSRNETLALEAVIRTNGTRPSLMLRDNAVPDGHPFLDDWRDDVLGRVSAIAVAASAVGRIEPTRGSPANYFGTGFVIDDQKHLVLTNRHVLEQMWRALRHVIDVRNGRYHFLDGAYIDFAAEIGATRRDRFKVVEAMFVGEDGPGLERLDAAVLKVRPLTPDEAAAERQQVSVLPARIRSTQSPDGAAGQLTSFCAIGFPGQVPPPSQRQGTDLLVDWNWVTYELMGGRYGVKRVAPGLVHKPLGSLADDPAGWCFGHDATTLGGNSGSPMLAWSDAGSPAFGIHFSGTSVTTNYAHACHRIWGKVDEVINAM